MNTKRIVSGIRPTGAVHLGNYLGAIRNAIALQESYAGFFFIADLHAITESHDRKTLAERTLSTAALYLACGIDPTRAAIFIQSHMPAHAQLARLLGAITPVGMLKRMIQFKEKAIKQGQEASLGLLDYPVLMAADILLYQPDLVPVGNDQKQHLELTKEVAERFNRQFGEGDTGATVFKIPEALVLAEGARIMSLTDGTKKMSKSDPNDNSRINLMDSEETIRLKIKRARTDSLRGLEFDNPARSEAHNLLAIYQLLSGISRDEAVSRCANIGYGDFKALLAETIIQALAPIQKRYLEIMQDRAYLDSVLRQGKVQAEAIANETLNNASKAMGFTHAF